MQFQCVMFEMYSCSAHESLSLGFTYSYTNKPVCMLPVGISICGYQGVCPSQLCPQPSPFASILFSICLCLPAIYSLACLCIMTWFDVNCFIWTRPFCLKERFTFAKPGRNRKNRELEQKTAGVRIINPLQNQFFFNEDP